MEQQVIDSIGRADAFGAAESAIAEWQKVLGETEAAIGEILQLREEIAGLNNEEATLLNGGELTESVAAKRLGELRNRRELKVQRLQMAERSLGSSRGGVLSPKELDVLRRRAAELEVAIKASIAEESQIFRGGGGRGLEVTHRLSAIRSERDKKVGELETAKARLSSHAAAAEFLVNTAAEAVRGQLQNLHSQLIEKRKCDVRGLLRLLCTESSEEQWKHHCGDFKSVKEVSDLRLGSPFDPAEARRQLRQIITQWNIEPLNVLIALASEQEQTIVTEAEEVAQAP